MKDAGIFEKVKNIEREIRELCDKRYRDGVSDGFDDGYNQGYFDAKGTNDDEIREQGRKDAWECAKKIYSLSAGEIINIFGGCSTWVNYSASEAIAKIKEYEEKQKRTCDTCQYKGWTLENNKKCAKCYDNSGWTPKHTEKKCSDCKHYVTDGHTTFCSLSKVSGCCVNKDNWTPKKMTLDEAIAHGKEQLEVFGGEHREFIEMAIKALNQEWILTSERPPEIDDEVIAYDGADVFVAWYGVNGWHSTDNRFDPRTPIIKWKPINLPKAEEKTNDSCWKEYYELKFMKKV